MSVEEQTLKSELDQLNADYDAKVSLYVSKQNELQSLKIDMEELDAKIGELQVKLNSFHYDRNSHDLGVLLMPDENPGSLEKTKALEKICENIYRGVLYPNGYTIRTNQLAVKIQLAANKPEQIPILMQGIRDFCAHLIPDKDGYFSFCISEATLSEFAVYTLFVDKDLSKAHIETHRGNPIFEGRLQDTLRFIQKNLWYTAK